MTPLSPTVTPSEFLLLLRGVKYTPVPWEKELCFTEAFVHYQIDRCLTWKLTKSGQKKNCCVQELNLDTQGLFTLGLKQALRPQGKNRAFPGASQIVHQMRSFSVTCVMISRQKEVQGSNVKPICFIGDGKRADFQTGIFPESLFVLSSFLLTLFHLRSVCFV